MVTNDSLVLEKYKNISLEGSCIDLIPVQEKDLENIVNLRNQKQNMYFFNQLDEITIESQKEWFEKYALRNNDIYWCIYKKDGTFIGTTRIYDIDLKNGICEQGSFAIDSNYANEAPYAVEALVLVFDFVFQNLEIEKVINQNRFDNKVMNNLSSKFGFRIIEKRIIHGVIYNYLLLGKIDYLKNRERFIKILDYWKKR